MLASLVYELRELPAARQIPDPAPRLPKKLDKRYCGHQSTNKYKPRASVPGGMRRKGQ